ncbi:MAG: cysteine desulfurase family protein [Anaerolineae bacterium]
MDRSDFIYMDHAATTPVAPEVLEAMRPYFSEEFGNASSLHARGRVALMALDQARATVAGLLSAHDDEIIFTSGGTESDNLAVRGVALASRERGNHLIVSSVEHKAVLKTAHRLAELHSFRVTELPVDGYGRVDPADVEAAVCGDTVLISVMTANNEVGTIQPVAEISQIAREHGIPFHTDAVQAGGYLDINVDRLGVDLLTLAGHKLYGPKGVGVLYVRRGTPLEPVQTGGSHERGRRAGTENVAGIVGMATALRLMQEQRPTEVPRLRRLRDRLIEGVLAGVPDAMLTGHPTERLPHNASFAIPGVEADGLLVALDLKGVGVASGSACTSGSVEPSHVLQAMNVPYEAAVGSLRLTLGHSNTDEHVDYVLEVLPEVVERMRAIAAVAM